MSEKEPNRRTFTISIKDQDNRIKHFEVTDNMKMSKVFKKYVELMGYGDVNAVKFLLDGDNVAPDQTPKMIGLEDGDQLDFCLMVTGG